MLTVELTGQIDENGQLQAELPPGLPAGKVDIRLQITPNDVSENDEPWTQDELDDMLVFEAKTGEEIIASGVVGGWAHRTDITDSQEFIEALRRKEQEADQWSEDS